MNVQSTSELICSDLFTRLLPKKFPFCNCLALQLFAKTPKALIQRTARQKSTTTNQKIQFSAMKSYKAIYLFISAKQKDLFHKIESVFKFNFVYPESVASDGSMKREIKICLETVLPACMYN